MEPGDVLDGRYRVEAVVGRGGMGTVWRATDLRLHRLVAVKTLHETVIVQDANAVARFQREMRVAASINHPGVVSVTDFGIALDSYYLVMEFIEGRTLAEVISDHPFGMPIETAIDFLEKLLSALSATHAKDVVHRDVKPGNVLIRSDTGALVLCDFGIGKSINPVTMDHVGTTGMFSGTFDYSSPEQIRGSLPLDQRNDLYASGCVLYEMLTGRPPFNGTGPEKIGAHLHTPPVPPSRLRAETPAWLDALTLELLAKKAVDRPRTSADVLRALAGGRSDVAAKSTVAPDALSPTLTATTGPDLMTPPVVAKPVLPAVPAPSQFFATLHAVWQWNGSPTPYAIKRRIIGSNLVTNAENIRENDLAVWIGTGDVTPRVRRDSWALMDSLLFALGVSVEERVEWNASWEAMWNRALESVPQPEFAPGNRRTLRRMFILFTVTVFLWTASASAAAGGDGYSFGNFMAAATSSLMVLLGVCVIVIIVDVESTSEYLIYVHEDHCIGSSTNRSYDKWFLIPLGLIALGFGIWAGVADPFHLPDVLGHWLGWRF